MIQEDFKYEFASLDQSTLVGHKDLKATQIYAKVVDKMKQDAAGKIKLDI